MKKLLIAIAGLAVAVAAALIAMFVFKICPPIGPWPAPPWCNNYFARQTYSVSTAAQKLPQIKAVNMTDTWGGNYNMNMAENTRRNIDSSFDRLQELGAEEAYVHDFDRAVFEQGQDFTATDYTLEDETFWNDMRDESMTEADIKKLADSAHARGLKLGIKRNISFVNIGKYISQGLSGNIQATVEDDYEKFNSGHSAEWIRDYFGKWNARMVEKAKIYQKHGVDIISLTPTWMGPTFAGQEELANGLQKQLIDDVRRVYKGQIHLELSLYGFLDGVDGQEDWSKYDYYKGADIVEVRIYKLPESYYSGEIDKSIAKLLSDLDGIAGRQGQKISIFFAPSSYSDSMRQGALEVLDYNSEAVKKAVPDYEYQSKAFETIFNSILPLRNIERINVASFPWDDALDPQVKPKLSVASTFRNKPAEALIKEWFNK